MLMSKRSFLIGSGALAAFGSSCVPARSAHAQLPRTPSGDLGPFYPVEKPLGTGADLTGNARAKGDIIELSGRILAADGTPQAHARVELWQANAVGRYAHPGDDRADVPLDPSFQGYADLEADADGVFRCRTVKPGPYPAGGTFQRAPHIHFDVRGRQRRLITQMYFESDTVLHAQDKVLQHDLWGKTTPLPSNIFAHLGEGAHYTFDIVL